MRDIRQRLVGRWRRLLVLQKRRRKSELGLGGSGRDANPVGHLTQFILGENGREPRHVQRPQGQIIERRCDRGIADDCHQALAEAGIFGMGLNRLARLPLHLPRVRQEIVQRAIGRQELDGRFGPNARNPGDIVAGIPGESQIVDHLLRR